jgi:hypothetical protein
VAELRGAGDEPDDGDASARRFAADTGDGTGEARPRYEPSPRAEYADVVRHNVAEANAVPADASPGGPDQADTAQESADQADVSSENESPEGVDSRAGDQPDTDQGNAGETDTDHGDAHQADPDQVGVGQAEADRSTEGSIADALERFDPRRAGLPEVSRAEAAAYIEEHLADRPWLTPARDCSPDVQRVIVALDQGHGHAHIRHEGWATEEMNERRVRKLEDPAQLDQDKREAGIDGLKNGSQPHRCGDIATRITDPEAFATAFARGVEHPDVRAALDSSGPVPRPVELPISEVLGEGGHKFCSGWQLEPANGSMLDAVANREAWLAGNRHAMEPRVRPVGTFEGGTVTYVFRPGAAGGHEIITMYVNPADEQSM